MPLSVYLLSLCTATMFVCNSLLITVSALIGFELAPDKTLATLPLALQFLAIMCSSIPASLLMGKIGRKPGFLLAALIGMLGGALAIVAITNRQFWLFCTATICFGLFNSFGNYYRFTAAEVVSTEKRNRAIAYVTAGGVIAGFLGPNLANWSQYLIGDQRFAGSFIIVIGVYLLNMLLVSQTQLPKPAPAAERKPGRPIAEIMRQPTFIVAVVCAMFGYGSMNLIMTATPLAMQAMDHSMSSTALVIQWHVVAMFAPSFFTGALIDRFGFAVMLAAGVVLGVVTVFINLSGTTVAHYVTSLVTLGLCWNFLFVTSTSLLTRCYEPHEKSRTQAANDFIVFTFVTVTALCSGGFHHLFGWRVINLSTLPLFACCAMAVWLLLRSTPKSDVASTPSRG